MLMQRGAALDSIQEIVDLPRWNHPSLPHFCVTFIMISLQIILIPYKKKWICLAIYSTGPCIVTWIFIKNNIKLESKLSKFRYLKAKVAFGGKL